jgi:hypothetical protein
MGLVLNGGKKMNTDAANVLISNFSKENARELTENGGSGFSTTTNPIVDLFGLGGALRARSDSEIIDIFNRAWSVDQSLALKTIFYFRDVRGGQGERRTFRVIIKWLATVAPSTVRKNIEHVASYGRYDDLFVLFDTPVEMDMLVYIYNQFNSDMALIGTDAPVSLLGKWMKSENTSSADSRAIGKRLRIALNLTPKQYRKSLSALRAKINVVERLMSSQQWSSIDYERVPSVANVRYRTAFFKNDELRFREYIKAVNSGEKKINTAAIYPYQIVEQSLQLINASFDQPIDADASGALTAMWNNLPDYFNGATEQSIVVADVSGSMSGTPLNVSISLAMYCAERNKGCYHNKFITFSNKPTMQTIVGNSIVEKVRNLATSHWEMNTNIKAVFDLILSIAIKNKVAPTDMLSTVYVVSDMEFDAATTTSSRHRSAVLTETPDESVFETIADTYQQAGYQPGTSNC